MSTPDSTLINPPLKVMLRNKAEALLTHGLTGTEWMLLGHLVGTPNHPETWKRAGQWRENNKRHDHDIVGLLNESTGEWMAFQGIELLKIKP